jgi:iron complex outermembrane receptor protein
MMASAGGGWNQPFYGLLLNLRHVGKQYLDNTGSEDRSVDAYTVVDLSGSLRFRNLFSFGDLTLDFRVNNLFDTEYETSGYYYNENYYYVGAGRNYYMSLSMKL